jgi:CBS domain containing-hemolysin-like protein
MSEMFWIDILKLGAVLLFVFTNGFFVAAEFSLVSVRRTRVTELVSQGNRGAKWVQRAIENPDKVIAATQLGITISSLALGWIGEPALAHLINPIIAWIPASIRSGASHSISAAIAFTLITFLHVVVGELAPKSIALQNPEATSLAVSRPTLWTQAIFKPVIWLLNGAGRLLLRVFGVPLASGTQMTHSVEELKMLVTASTEGGVVEEDEREMLHAIFDIGDLLVRQVMVPRTEIVAVEADTRLKEVVDIAIQSLYTKFPVYEDNLDQIVGVLHIKEVLRKINDADDEGCTARQLAREPFFVPEAIPAIDLLRQLRSRRQHLAIVLDEYGGTAGLVTLEDLLEEIVGEVSDQFDVDEPEIQTLPDGTALIDGFALIEEVNEELQLTLNDPHYDTIAGYILGRLGRIARQGDVVESEGVRLRVVAMDGLRIARIALSRVPKADQPPGVPPAG